MKFGLPLCAALCAFFLSSCMTSTLTAAAAAGPGVVSLASAWATKAPEAAEMVGRHLSYGGTLRGVDNVSRSTSGSISFGATNPTNTQVENGVKSVFYSRQAKKLALVTITTPAGVETYRLTFTKNGAGTYIYEKRHGADFATGEGNFSIQ